jgi:hypothetical protein
MRLLLADIGRSMPGTNWLQGVDGAKLGSSECVEMVRKYAHLSSDHLVPYVDRTSGLRLVQDGEVATLGLRAAK